MESQAGTRGWAAEAAAALVPALPMAPELGAANAWWWCVMFKHLSGRGETHP